MYTQGTAGGPGRATKMLVLYIFSEAFDNYHYGTASAIAMVLLLVVLTVTVSVLVASS